MSALSVRPQYRYHPRVETLEPRRVPSTFIVTNTADSGPGSLRQAILDSNQGPPSFNTIAFAIPGSGIHQIMPVTSLPVIESAATIDGTTQPGYRDKPLIRLLGPGTASFPGLTFNALRFDGPAGVQGLTVRGFSTGILLEGESNNYPMTVEADHFFGNGIGLEVNDGHNLVDQNVISDNVGDGLLLYAAGGNTIQNNRIGTDKTGTIPLGNGGDGIHLVGQEGAGNRILDNVISANAGTGVDLSGGGYSAPTLIQGNRIGVDATGTVPMGNGGDGVRDADGDRVLDNIIAANAGNGVSVPLQDTTIRGNQIASNGANGVLVYARLIANETVAENVVSGNANDGVLVDGAQPVTITGNQIFANGNLGIELLNNGNHDQPAPILTSAKVTDRGMVVRGTLTAAPDSTYTLEFFGPSDQLGSATVTTDDSGYASIAVTVAPAEQVMATATDALGNTSEFSPGLWDAFALWVRR